MSCSANPVIDSTCKSVRETNLLLPRSLFSILNNCPTCSQSFDSIFAHIWTFPSIRVVSSEAMGTSISILVFVEFQTSVISFPPLAITEPVEKSSGGVLSKTTQLPFVVLVTSIPLFPAESEKVRLKETKPSKSESVN